MESVATENKLFSLLFKWSCFIIAISITSSASAEYYVVYSTGEYIAAPPPPVVYTQTQCTVKKHRHRRTHYRTVVHHPRSRAVVSVYYVFNTPAFGQCGGCNGGGQVWVPATQGCSYNAYYGTPAIRHSDYYYMQGTCEDDYGPDIDGNTGDNDIYY